MDYRYPFSEFQAFAICLSTFDTKPVEGGGKKFKPKVVFRQQSMVVSDRHGRSSSDNSTPPDEIGGKADEEMDEFMAESQLIYHDKESEQPENRIVPFEPAHKHDSKGNSMVDFLYSFEESSKQLEVLDSVSPSCSDDEENHRNLKLAMPTRTMADQFHEAFGTVDVIDERPHVTFSRPSCNGMYGKLQEVILSEKERDIGYLNSLSAEPGFKDERMYIFVRILTRALEAKLIVCSCSRVKDGKKSEWLKLKSRGVGFREELKLAISASVKLEGRGVIPEKATGGIGLPDGDVEHAVVPDLSVGLEEWLNHVGLFRLPLPFFS
ncbi:tubby-like F-box protein 5 [Phtheirospermum japonicum]|uniref:Tubby-like F-box protein 5 n=1 Tax=Phtheirospermum japonicum TaxID=374723 RepID=A0A830C9A7_9LAMI|nr:tubby-like F-box protein 5 [Phtheirospermum japonicum]